MSTCMDQKRYSKKKKKKKETHLPRGPLQAHPRKPASRASYWVVRANPTICLSHGLDAISAS
jgi:hypothetical protein